MKILVIGAGWFGCHIAKTFFESGLDVTILEKEKKIFASMSGNNSNRLHRGFHYPRAQITRKQCISGFENFKKIYPFLCNKIQNNYIAIHTESKLNFNKYIEVIKEENLNYEIADNKFSLKNIQGIIKCSEEVIDFQKASKYFLNYFKINKIKLKLNHKFDINEHYTNELINKYNYIIDCTACTLKKTYDTNILYEPRITLLYKSNLKNFALMLMDGPFWSIYPQNKNIYTVGSVIHSRISNGLNTFDEALNVISKFGKNDLKTKIKNFQMQISKDFDKFNEYFSYCGYYLSLATLFDSKDDERPLNIYKNGNFISILGGKIDTVIEAGNKVRQIILQ